MTKLTVVPDPEAVARRTAERLAEEIAAAQARGSSAVHVALAGGSSPQRANEVLAGMDVDWSGVHLWLSDERCVPADHEDANQLMVVRSLVERIEGPVRPVLHGVRGELEPEDAAWLYGLEIVREVGEEPVFDVVQLGLGPDGHTASLFPGHDEAYAAEAPVIAVRTSPKPPPRRVTFTLPLIARARYTQLVVAGAGKREALAGVRSSDQRLPPGRLGDGLDEIICDEAAAGRA
jgi:6-phosphogluconolactonase